MPIEINSTMNLTVNEIFYSIQGESAHAGLPCVFVRLTGCNLRCRFCDTRYAFEEGRRMSIRQIVEQVNSFGCRLVEITGGEPLVQNHTPALVEALLSGGFEVLMETNGSLDINRVDRRCRRIMDIKCPSSGEMSQNDPENRNRLTANDQVKFVIGDQADFQFAVDMVSHLPARLPAEHILLSAVADRLPIEQLAQWLLQARVRARLQIQLHNIIWPNQNRGV